MSSGTERAQDVVYPFPLGRIPFEEKGRGRCMYFTQFQQNVLTSWRVLKSRHSSEPIDRF